MKKILLLTLCLFSMLLTSCLKGETSKQSSSAPYVGECVVEKAGEVVRKEENFQIEITIPNATEKILDITFHNLSFTAAESQSGMPPQNITISGIPFTETISDDGRYKKSVFEKLDVIPTIGGVAYDMYPIKRIWGEIGATVTVCFELANQPLKVIFTTGDIDKVPSFVTYSGLCVVEKEGTEVSRDNNFSIEIKTVGSVMDITFHNLSFAPGMPPQNITISNISFIKEVADNGYKKSVFDQGDIIPTIEGTPYENYKIKRVWGEVGDAIQTIYFELATMPFKVTFTTDNI